MVNRFGIGSGNATQGRVFRGAPVEKKQVQEQIVNQSNQTQEQKAQLQSEINNLQSQLSAVERARQNPDSKTQRRDLQVRYYGLVARINYLQGAVQGLNEGTYYEDLSLIQEGATQAEIQAKGDARDRITGLAARQVIVGEKKLIQIGGNPKPSTNIQIGGNAKPTLQPGQPIYLPLEYLQEIGVKPGPQPNSTMVQVSKGSQSPYQKFTSEPTVSLKEAYQTFSRLDVAAGNKLIRLAAVENVGLFTASFEAVRTQTPTFEIVVGRPLTQAAFAVGSQLVYKAYEVSFGRYLDKLTKTTSKSGLLARPALIPTVEEVSYIKIAKDGEAMKVSNYLITAETKPPVFKAEVAEGIFFTLRKEAAKLSYTRPLTNIINDQPYIAITYKEGSKLIKFQNVGGGSKIFNPITESNDLSKLQKFTLARLAQSTGGVSPLSATFAKGEVYTYKLTKLNLGTKTLTILGNTGKRSGRFLTISEIRPSIETLKYESFLTETFYKDIGNPLARRTGKTPQLKGQLLIFKEPIIEAGSFESINLGKIGGGKGSEVQLAQIQKLLKQSSPKPIPQVFSKINSLKLEISNQRLDLAIPSLSSKQIQISTQEVKMIQQSSQSSFQIDFQVPSFKGATSTKQEPITKQIPSTKQEPASKSIQSNRLLLKTIPKLEQKPLQKLLQRPVQKQVSKGKNRGFPILLPNPFPKQKEPILDFKLPKFRALTERTPGTPFTVFVRRRGKFKPIARTKTFNEALNIGRGKVANSLAATFKISGFKGNIATPFGFRKKKSKKEGVVLIELPKFRLSTSGEKREIRRIRKR